MDSKKEDKEKELFPVTTSRWNSNIEQNIKEIGESCKGYKWMHISSAKISMRRYNIFMYTTIFIGPIVGLLGAISTVKDSFLIDIFIVVCGFISGVLASIVKYGKFQQKSVDHKTAAAKYASLEGNVRRQLSLYREDRVNVGKYLQWIFVSFDDMFSGSPLISNKIYTEWAEFAHKHNLFIPKEYGILLEIDITGQIQQLADVGEIKVNSENSSSVDLDKNVSSTHAVVDIPSNEKQVVKNVSQHKIKRTSTYTVFPELNKFRDARMQYELSRLYGLDS